MAWVRVIDGYVWEPDEPAPKPQPEVVKNITPVEPQEIEPQNEIEPEVVEQKPKTYKPKKRK